MYASLIGAGVSQLYNALQGLTSSSSSSSDSPFSTASSPSSSTSPATVASSTSGSLSSDVSKLLLDLQSAGGAASSATSTDATQASSGSADPTTTVAGDLQSVFGDLGKTSGAHGHHHHHHGGGEGQSAPGGSSSGTTAAATAQSSTDPFQKLAASLIAYTNSQGLSGSPSSTTSLTA